MSFSLIRYLYKLAMTDSGGDGWGGSGYNITAANGVSITGTMSSGESLYSVIQ